METEATRRSVTKAYYKYVVGSRDEGNEGMRVKANWYYRSASPRSSSVFIFIPSSTPGRG